MKRFVSSLLILCVLATTVPNPEPVKAQLFGGNIVFDPTNVVQNTTTAAQSAVQSALTNALVIKEYTLDGIAYGIARTIIQSMVQSIITWINSGFNGSPAFVTDLERYLQRVADQIVSDTLLGSDLAFLCDPFELDIRIALATDYNQRRDALGDIPPAQCTLGDVSNNVQGFLSGDFSQGGWPAWFELTQSEANDPNRAYFRTQFQLQQEILNEQAEENQYLEFGDGFLSFRVCENTAAASGVRENCTITTPGRVISDQLNGALNAGRDMLITADEIDEIIGALLAQLAQQALTGAFGLLGLGGNSTFSDNSYGAAGNTSYLDALANEQVTTPRADGSVGGGVSTGAFDRAIQQTERYTDALDEVDSRVASLRDDYDEAAAFLIAESCTVPTWPADFGDVRDGTTTELEQFATVTVVLEELRDRLDRATDPLEQNDIMNQYFTLEQAGLVPTTSEITQLEFYIQFQLRDDIRNYRNRLDAAVDDCNDGG